MTTPITAQRQSGFVAPGTVAQQDVQLMDLPRELIIGILANLNTQDVRACKLLSKECNQLSETNSLWKPLLMARFPHMDSRKVENFHDTYKKLHILRSNLAKGLCASEKLYAHQDAVTSLAIINGELFSSSKDKTLKLWDLNSYACIRETEFATDYITSIANYEGKPILGFQQGGVTVFHPWKDGCMKHIYSHAYSHTDDVTSLVVANGVIFSSSMDGQVKIWDRSTAIFTSLVNESAITSIIPIDKLLIIGLQNGIIVIWDLSQAVEKHAFQDHTDRVTSFVVVDGKMISASLDKTIKIRDLKTLVSTGSIELKTAITSLVVAEGMLISGHSDGMIMIHELSNLTCTASFKGHSHSVTSLVYADDNLISASEDNTIATWNFAILDKIVHSNLVKGAYASRLLEGPPERVGLMISDQESLFSCSDDKTIKIWDLTAELPTCTMILEGHTGKVVSLAIANRTLYSGSLDKTIKIWDLNTTQPTCVATLTGHTGTVGSLAVGDRKLFSGSLDNTIKIWDLNTSPPICTDTLTGGYTGVLGSLIFADGKLFSCPSSSNEIKIWDLNTAPPSFSTLKYDAQNGNIKSLTYANGKLFSGFSNGVIKIWDANINPPICTATLEGHQDGVISLVIGHGKLFSRSHDLSIKIWDLNTNPPTCTATLSTEVSGTLASLTFANGKLFSSLLSSIKAIQMYDFTAKENAIFKEIASQFNGDSDAYEKPIERFSRMPESAKNKINEQLYKIIKSNSLEGFQDMAPTSLEMIPTDEQWAQAIFNYLKEQGENRAES